MAVPMANDPPFATLNHFAADLGIPSESDLLRIGLRHLAEDALHILCVRTLPSLPVPNPSALIDTSSGASTIATTSYWPRVQNTSFTVAASLSSQPIHHAFHGASIASAQLLGVSTDHDAWQL